MTWRMELIALLGCDPFAKIRGLQSRDRSIVQRDRCGCTITLHVQWLPGRIQTVRIVGATDCTGMLANGRRVRQRRRVVRLRQVTGRLLPRSFLRIKLLLLLVLVVVLFALAVLSVPAVNRIVSRALENNVVLVSVSASTAKVIIQMRLALTIGHPAVRVRLVKTIVSRLALGRSWRRSVGAAGVMSKLLSRGDMLRVRELRGSKALRGVVGRQAGRFGVGRSSDKLDRGELDCQLTGRFVADTWHTHLVASFTALSVLPYPR